MALRLFFALIDKKEACRSYVSIDVEAFKGLKENNK